MEEQTTVSTTPAAAASSGCFDCNICLDFAAEPVVTLCGHLYCWPCIYKWLRHTNVHTGQCPVCKAVVSQESLVPLYGRGQSFQKKHNLQNQNQVIPRRPQPQPQPHRETNANQPSVAEQHEYVYPMSAPMLSPVIHSTAGGVLGGMALAVLPWLTRNGAAHIPASMFYTSPYHFVTVGRQRQQELAMEKVLHQLCIFLSVFALLCLFLF